MISGKDMWVAENVEEIDHTLDLITQNLAILPGSVTKDTRMDRLRKVLESCTQCHESNLQLRVYTDPDTEAVTATVLFVQRGAALEVIAALMLREINCTVNKALSSPLWCIEVAL